MGEGLGSLSKRTYDKMLKWEFVDLGNTALWRFEGSNAIEIRNEITFDFYTGLPHTKVEMVKMKRQLTSSSHRHDCVNRLL